MFSAVAMKKMMAMMKGLLTVRPHSSVLSFVVMTTKLFKTTRSRINKIEIQYNHQLERFSLGLIMGERIII